MRHISPRGRAILTASVIIGGGLLTGAPSGAEGVGWLSALAATLGGLLAVLALSRFGAGDPSRGFFDALRRRLGAPASTAATLILALATLGVLARDVAVITKFVSANMIADTPDIIIAAAFAACCAWCAAAGRSTVGRWVELTALPALVLLLAALALAVRDFSIAAVLDGVEDRYPEILPGAVGVFAESFGAAFIASAVLLPFDRSEERPALPLVVGTLIGGVTLAVVYLFNVALLGSETIELFNFPTYHALRVSGLDGVLERMEALLMLPAVVFALARVAAGLTLLSAASSRLCRRLEGKKLVPFAFAAVAVALAFALFPSQLELRRRTEAVLGIYAALWAITAATLALAAKRRSV